MRCCGSHAGDVTAQMLDATLGRQAINITMADDAADALGTTAARRSSAALRDRGYDAGRPSVEIPVWPYRRTSTAAIRSQQSAETWYHKYRAGRNAQARR